MGLLNKAHNKYEEEGIVSVLRSAPPFLLNKPPFWLDERKNNLVNRIAIDRDTLQNRCEVSNQIYYYTSTGSCKIPSPLSSDVPDEFKRLIGTHDVSPNFVCELDDVRLFGPWAICQAKTGGLIIESMGKNSTLRNRLLASIDRVGRPMTFKSMSSPFISNNEEYDYELAAHLVARHGPDHDTQNYGHWVCENLPQLKAIEHYHNVTGNKPVILINQDPPSWMIDTLQLMGFSSYDIVEWDQATAKVKKLVLPNLNYIHSFGSKLDPVGRRWVRERMIANVDNVRDEFSNYVFITRENVRRRTILNLDEIKDCLKPLGFEFYQPEDLSMEKEIRLFSQADIIVGPYGSGMNGIMYSNDALVVNIFPPNYFPTQIYLVASELGLKYDFVQGEDRNTDISSHYQDIYLKPEKIEDTITGAIDSITFLK